jgi:ubiquinone/menaquinone biosynthesis C-methylase UbiE
MDYKDYEAGISSSFFFFKGNNERIYIQFKKLKKRNLKILDLGTGTGDNLNRINEFGSVYVIDIEKRALDTIPDHLCVEKKVSDACNLDYPDKYFDVVSSFGVFEHILDDWKAVSEIYRVLKPEGVLIFSVAAFQSIFSAHDIALDHKRRYSKKMIKELFSDFKNLKMYYWNTFLFFPVAISRILKKNAEPKVMAKNLPNMINSIFYSLLNIENQLIKKDINLPIGLTIIGSCEK